MPVFKNKTTGIVVEIPQELADRLGVYEPVEEDPPRKPGRPAKK